jgi:hypothetical protein
VFIVSEEKTANNFKAEELVNNAASNYFACCYLIVLLTLKVGTVHSSSMSVNVY